MTQQILIASGNKKKLSELQAICASLPLKVLGPERLRKRLPYVEEDQPDFLGNARKKALAFAKVAQEFNEDIWVMADDSGLCVDALGGKPGVLSARYAGCDSQDRDIKNNQKLLRKLKGVPKDLRGASFKCAIAIAHKKQILFQIERDVKGKILENLDGEGGFGYDPLFYHVDSACTFAQLSWQEKSRISHRGKAVAEIRRILKDYLTKNSE